MEQLLEIIFTFFTLKVVDEAEPAPVLEVLAEEEVLEDPVPEAESEPLPGVPITRI